MSDHPTLPERIDSREGFKDHPDWERVPLTAGTGPGVAGLKHKPTGLIYFGFNYGKEWWSDDFSLTGAGYCCESLRRGGSCSCEPYSGVI